MTIRPRDRETVLQALRAGVVPRVGQQLIQVGREAELNALLTDIERVADGGSAFRLIVGEYGSGKTFFMNLVRAVALERKLVVTTVDLTPDRRLQATGGQARALYAELMRNIATRTRPEGGALQAIVERFVATIQEEAKTQGANPEDLVRVRLASITELVGGYDFASVISAYWQGFIDKNESRMGDAVRWLRGEFATKTDARAALGVRSIIDDASIYDHLKLMARIVRLAGYAGFLVCLDEMVNLYKLSNTQARTANYEQILRILNDTLQVAPEGLGFLLGGTPEFLTDNRRGLYSYSALQSRLAENAFARDGRVDLTGPVVRLSALTPEDFLILLRKIRDLYKNDDPRRPSVPDEVLLAFMEHCFKRVGEAYFRTPRTTITSFINLLAILEQNQGTDWRSLLGQIAVEAILARRLRSLHGTTVMTSPPSESDSPAPYERLRPEIQRWIWEHHWSELRDVQARAVPALLDGSGDLIISAIPQRVKPRPRFSRFSPN